MTATRAEVRTAIVDLLDGVDGLETVYGFRPSSPNPPCAIVPLFGYDPTIAFGGVWRATVPILVLVAFADAEAADANLAALMEPSSIVAAFNADPSLGLSEVNSSVLEWTDAEVIGLLGAEVLYLSSTITLDVIAT